MAHVHVTEQRKIVGDFHQLDVRITFTNLELQAADPALILHAAAVEIANAIARIKARK